MNITTSETINAVRVVTLNRPNALNAFNQDLFDALCEDFLEAAEDNSVKVSRQVPVRYFVDGVRQADPL